MKIWKRITSCVLCAGLLLAPVNGVPEKCAEVTLYAADEEAETTEPPTEPMGTTEPPTEPAASSLSVGNCGSSLLYRLTSNGVLQISGSGEMDEFKSASSVPWNHYRDRIKTLHLSDHMTNIGKWAFCFTNLNTVEIPSSVTGIGQQAFSECANLKSIIIPESVTSIGADAFSGCPNLTIYGKEGSYAEQYAKENGIPFADSHVGKCGENATWTLDDNGRLVISGTGGISQFSSDLKFKIKAVVINQGVTSIGNEVFKGCTSLTSVNIPDSVTSIGAGAFSGCPNLTIYGTLYSCAEQYAKENGITFVGPTIVDKGTCGENVTWTLDEKGTLTIIGTGKMTNYSIIYSDSHSPFYGNDKIKKVDIKPGVTSIGESVFYGCRSLTSVTIPDSVTSIGNDAFYRCKNLTSVTIPNSVTFIGKYAFEDCTSLTSVTIPDSVEIIGEEAFCGCTDLISINVSEGNPNFTSIDGIAYSKDMKKLVLYPVGKKGEFVVPDGVTSIGNNAFSHCENLTDVTLPDSVTYIGREAFYQCPGLKSVTILNQNCTIYNEGKTICNEWFYNNDNNGSFTGIIYGYTDSSAQSYAERYDRTFKALTGRPTAGKCGDHLTWKLDEKGTLTISGEGKMPDYDDKTKSPFINNAKIKTVIIQSGVETIGNSVFDKCTNLTSVSIPDSVTSIGVGAFFRCTSLTSVYIPDGVTEIRQCAFENCTSLKSVTIPDSVTKIGAYAFENCTSLKSVTIPDSVESIEAHMFRSCTSLTSVKVSANHPNYISIDGVLYSKDGSYLICFPRGKGETFTIPDIVSRISDEAFYYCLNLTSVTIGSSVESIGYRAFYGCTNLTSVSILNPHCRIDDSRSTFCNDAGNDCAFTGTIYGYEGSTAQEYAQKYGRKFEIKEQGPMSGKCGKDAFWKLDDEGTLTISGTGELEATYSPFKSDVRIKKVIIEPGVTNIRSLLFSGCTSLTSIELPDSVTSIGWSAFSGCTSLTSIELPDSVTSIGEKAFEDCTSLTSITLQPGLESISRYTFTGCTSLTSITLPDSVTSIGEKAFEDCTSLTSVSIPDSVTKNFSYTAFIKCSSLTSITVSEGNTKYTSIDGALYTKGGEKLLICPGGKENFTVSDTATSIGGSAFWFCTNLTSVTIPDSVTSIGEKAFSGCTSLTSVTLPDSLTEIPSSTFYGCSSLPSVTIPACVTSIGNEAFKGCNSLTSITVSADNPEFSGIDGALYSKDGATLILCPNGREGEFTVSDTATAIKSGAFDECTNLTAVTLPDSMTSIARYIFSQCTSLNDIHVSVDHPGYTSIDGVLYSKDMKGPIVYPVGRKGAYTIPDGVTSIGYVAFHHCTNLTAVTIPDSVTSIDSYAFNGCTGLTSVTIPGSVTSIGNDAFEQCTNLTSVTIADGVTSIGRCAFKNCTSLTSVTIPGSVTSIEESAFYGCTNLTSVTIPDGVTSIGSWAFQNCTSLTSVTIPDSVTKIGGSVFSNTAWLDEKRKEDPLVIAGHLLIDGKQASGDIIIPDGVIDIAKSAFNEASLTSVTIPGSVTSIGNDAFEQCTNLTSVTISDGVTNIGGRAFYGCKSLSSVTIPDSVTNIGEYAFYGCKSLSSVTIPDSVTSIGDNAFAETAWLNAKQDKDPLVIVNHILINGTKASGNIIIPDNVTSIGGSAFFGCTSLTSIELPDSVTSIGGSAFSGCTSLTSIELPDSVTSIGGSAFFGCTSLTSIELPDSVTSIGVSAFSGCTCLNSVTILNPKCEIADYESTFSDKYDSGTNLFTGTIYGYEGSTAQAYAEKYGRKFEAIKEIPTVPSLALPQDSIKLRTEKTYPIPQIIDGLTYTALDPEIADVTDTGLVTALTEGKASIKVMDSSGRETVLTVEVVPSDTDPYPLGNPNGDEAINAKDATIVLIAAARLGTGGVTGFTDEQATSADVNHDDAINAKDATAILRYAAAVGTGTVGKISDYT